MSDNAPDRPGNNGGKLKTGNTKNVGRKPQVVRQMYLEGAGDFATWIRKVAAGKQCIPVLNGKGEQERLRIPTFEERKQAGEVCAKYGLGTRTDVTTADDKVNLVVLDI